MARPCSDQFEICLNRITRAVPLFLMAFGTFVLLVLGLMAVAGGGDPIMLLIAIGPVVFITVGWIVPKFLFYDVLFDRGAGQMTYRWLGRTQIRPLSAIVAVQLVAGKILERETGVFELTPGHEHSYQVNLVFNDATRLCLSNHGVRCWSEQLATDLAQFLTVPHVIWLDSAANVISELDAQIEKSRVTMWSRLESSVAGCIDGAGRAGAILAVAGAAIGAIFGEFGGGVWFPFAGAPVKGVIPAALLGMAIGIMIGVPFGAIAGLVGGAFRPELLAWLRRSRRR